MNRCISLQEVAGTLGYDDTRSKQPGTSYSTHVRSNAAWDPRDTRLADRAHPENPLKSAPRRRGLRAARNRNVSYAVPTARRCRWTRVTLVAPDLSPEYEGISWRWVLSPEDLLAGVFEDTPEEFSEEFVPPHAAVNVVSRARLVGTILWWFGPSRSGDTLILEGAGDDDEEPPSFSRLDDATGWLLCSSLGLDPAPMLEGLRQLRRMDQPILRVQLARRHGWSCHICGDQFPSPFATSPPLYPSFT